MPHRASVAQPWRMQDSRYRLIGTRCECGQVDFPPRNACSKCSGQVEPVQLSGNGEVFSFTVIHTAPEGFEGATPYSVGLIKLKEGPIITAQIVGNAGDIRIGRRVKTVFRKLNEHGSDGLIHYGFKFEVME